MKIVSIGEILWDVFSDGERLGGAPFNFAVHAMRLGHDVWFVSAVGDDERGRRALERMRELGLSTEFVRVAADAPTGSVTVSLKDGEPDYVIHRPAAYDFLEVPEIGADWFCFGTLAPALTSRAFDAGVPLHPPHKSPARQSGGKRFYDVNLRKNSYSLELVEHRMQNADVVKLNEAELAYLGRSLHKLRDDFQLEACCVTLADRGCAVLIGDDYAEVPAHPVKLVDAVGAGDAFAAAFLHGYNERWPAKQIGDFANRLASRIAAQRGAI